MKSTPLVLCLSLLASFCFPQNGSAQQRLREEVPDIQQLHGYTIRIIRLDRDAYGYEIRRGPTVLVHQRRNPFTGSETGLRRKADALKTATWVLENLVTKEQMLPRSRRLPETSALSRPIPSSVAAALGVTLDRQP
jgi:hypothetical protein